MPYVDPGDPSGRRPPRIVNHNDSLGYVLRAIRAKLIARGETVVRVAVMGSAHKVFVDFDEIEGHTEETDVDWENQLADSKDAALDG